MLLVPLKCRPCRSNAALYLLRGWSQEDSYIYKSDKYKHLRKPAEEEGAPLA